MGTAYTPGLLIESDVLIRKSRRLPLAGRILVQPGQQVESNTPVAEAELPGELVTLRVSEELGIEPSELPGALRAKQGERVSAGQLIAEVKGFFGLFRSGVHAPCSGVLEFASPVTGHVGIRRERSPLVLTAFIKGHIAEVRPPDTVVVQTRGALVQGVFGVGGEAYGTLICPVDSPGEPLRTERLPKDLSGKIVVGGAYATEDAWRALIERKAAGLIMASLRDSELTTYLGYELGIAITGQENVPFPVIITEGFGHIPMAEKTFRLLKTLEGRACSMSGQTQIRAGAVRPELIAPSTEVAPADAKEPQAAAASASLAPGTRVRLIRHPRFGRIARVAELPEEPRQIPTGAKVRVVVVELEPEREGGVAERVAVPRSNVELFSD